MIQFIARIIIAFISVAATAVLLTPCLWEGPAGAKNHESPNLILNPWPIMAHHGPTNVNPFTIRRGVKGGLIARSPWYEIMILHLVIL